MEASDNSRGYSDLSIIIVRFCTVINLSLTTYEKKKGSLGFTNLGLLFGISNPGTNFT